MAPWVNPPSGRCKHTDFPQVGVLAVCRGLPFLLLAGQVLRGSSEVEAHLWAGPANIDCCWSCQSWLTNPGSFRFHTEQLVLKKGPVIDLENVPETIKIKSSFAFPSSSLFFFLWLFYERCLFYPRGLYIVKSFNAIEETSSSSAANS